MNSSILFQLLIKYGIQFSSCTDDGIVYGLNGVTQIQARPDVAWVITNYSTLQPEAVIEDYLTALAQFLDQTSVDRGYQNEQDCLNGSNSTDPAWQADATTMMVYDQYCHVTLNGVFGYTGNTRLPGERQMNPPPPPSIYEFLNSTLNTIGW